MTASLRSSRHSIVTFIETPRSQAKKQKYVKSKMDLFASPLTKLKTKKAEEDEEDGLLLANPSASANKVQTQMQISQLVNITERFSEVRDKLICQGVIVRSL